MRGTLQGMAWMSVPLVCLSLVIPVSMAQAESLQQVVRKVVECHPLMQAAHEQEFATHEAIKEAKGGYFPQISAFAATGRERSSNPTVRSFMQTSTTLHRDEASIFMSQLLYDGGRTSGRVANRRHLNQSARFETHEVREGLILQTAEAYLNVMRHRNLVELSQANVNVHRSILEKVKLRYKGGAGRRVDVELGVSRLTRARAQYEREVGDRDAANANYYVVTGVRPPRSFAFPQLPLKFLPDSLEAGIKKSLESNPQLRVAEADYLARASSVKTARSAFFPNVHLEVSASENKNLDGVEGRNRDFQGMLVGRYDVWRGGSDLATLREAQHERNRAMRLLQNARRDVIENMKISWARMEEARREMDRLQLHVQSTAKVVEDYKKQFSLGQRPLFNVLDAENDLYNAKRAYSEAKYNYAIGTYRVIEAMGCLTVSLLTNIPA